MILLQVIMGAFLTRQDSKARIGAGLPGQRQPRHHSGMNL
jgi:hypothetical protein